MNQKKIDRFAKQKSKPKGKGMKSQLPAGNYQVRYTADGKPQFKSTDADSDDDEPPKKKKLKGKGGNKWRTMSINPVNMVSLMFCGMVQVAYNLNRGF